MAELDELPAVTRNEETKALPTQATSTSTSSKKRSRKRPTKTHIETQFTIRNPSWAYIRLERLTSSPKSTTPTLDEVTAQLYLTSALSQFLGLHGAAIPFDILKIEEQDVWLRIPADNRSALLAAVGGWVSSNGEGWRVKGWSSWDANVMNSDTGQDLFAD